MDMAHVNPVDGAGCHGDGLVRQNRPWLTGDQSANTGSNEYPIGPDYAHHSAATYFNMRKTSIYGGSNEIQRNIITKMILGL